MLNIFINYKLMHHHHFTSRLVISNFLNLLHVWRLLVASNHQVDQRQKGPNHKSYQKHTMLVKRRVKLHVVNLQPKNHIDLRVRSKGRERTYAQLHHPH